ncbi:MAG: arginine--tRNA ligase [Rhodospirillaceae bacterium]|nr:MAG: arginine--tRNA ligase [Rhodospirillaceae bacterium]
MNLFKYFQAEVLRVVEEMTVAGELPSGLDSTKIVAEPPREAAHGDVSTNAALVLAKAAGKKPRELAERIALLLAENTMVAAVTVAGPGFINLRLTESFWCERLGEILSEGTGYGDSDFGQEAHVNVEYVSANPTGPMHIGHGRGAVIGDVLASLLEKVGYRVTREYYINDAGAQINKLAQAVYLRYREFLGIAIGPDAFEDSYPGDYLKPVAEKLAEKYGREWVDAPPETWRPVFRDFAIDEMMALIREDLKALGIVFDRFSSERVLVAEGGVDAALQSLEAKGLVYEGVLEPPKGKLPDDWEARPQTLFRSTDFGDDVDRPLKKSDGSWTYFATDIAYHLDKFQRGFASMIDVWGADHGGYVKRMVAAVAAITDGRGALDVKLCQLVSLLEDGVQVKMSKRAGTFVSLREVVDEVGKDVVRFIMLTRKNDAPLDFDTRKVCEQTRDNPVFYVQYAHARAKSVLRHGKEKFPDMDLGKMALAGAALNRLTAKGELALIRKMADWPRQVEMAARFHEPHRIAFYLYDLASEFHGLWNQGNEDADLRFLIAEDSELSRARLGLVLALTLVIASGLEIFGVAQVEEMR